MNEFFFFSLFFSSSKRRRNDEIPKGRKSNEDEMEVCETAKTNGNGNASSPPPVKRVPLSLEEMLEKNKKEQEAISKVKLLD